MEVRSFCKYTFRFEPNSSSQNDLKIVLAHISNTKSKIAILSCKGQRLPEIDFGGNADTFEIDNGPFGIAVELLHKLEELKNLNQYQTIFSTNPDGYSHVLFMALPHKTMRQKILEKKLFKFAKSILP